MLCRGLSPDTSESDGASSFNLPQECPTAQCCTAGPGRHATAAATITLLLLIVHNKEYLRPLESNMQYVCVYWPLLFVQLPAYVSWMYLVRNELAVDKGQRMFYTDETGETVPASDDEDGNQVGLAGQF